MAGRALVAPRPGRGPARVGCAGARGLELMDPELMYAELGRALADREVPPRGGEREGALGGGW